MNSFGRQPRISTLASSTIMASDAKVTIAAQTVAKCGGAGPTWRNLTGSQRARLRGLTGYLIILTLLFVQPLTRLMRYSVQSSLQSYILLVPFISGYLLYIRRGRLSTAYRSSILGTVTLGGIGIAILAAGTGWRGSLSC